MIKVGINGFGRIGRAIFRINSDSREFDVVAINDLNPSNANLAYMLNYDSTYGVFDANINSDEDSLILNDNHKISMYHIKNISEVPWEKHNIDIVIDGIS